MVCAIVEAIAIVPYVEQYIEKCYIDKKLLDTHEAHVMWRYFLNEHGEEVCVHIPTKNFNHHENLGSYEPTEALKRAWEAFSAFMIEYKCKVTNFNG